MISDDQRQLIEEKMEELPSNVKEAIESSGWEKKIVDIGNRYKLHVDDLDLLGFELALAMVGMSDQNEFMRQMKQELRLGDETLDNIVGDINSEIFSHIREKLKEDVEAEENYQEPTTVNREEELSRSEKVEMQKAGIRLGDDEDLIPVEAPKEIKIVQESPETEKVEIKSPEELEEMAKIADLEDKKKESGPTAQVFKTKIVGNGEKDKPSNYFDPYREPLE